MQTFSLFNFVNKRNNMIQGRVKMVRCKKRDKLQVAGLQQEKDDLFLLNNIDEEIKKTGFQSQYFENQRNIFSQDLDVILTRGCNILSKTVCDCPVIKEAHGSGVREKIM